MKLFNYKNFLISEFHLFQQNVPVQYSIDFSRNLFAVFDTETVKYMLQLRALSLSATLSLQTLQRYEVSGPGYSSKSQLNLQTIPFSNKFEVHEDKKVQEQPRAKVIHAPRGGKIPNHNTATFHRHS